MKTTWDSSTTRNKINALKRLNDLTGQLEDIVRFLMDEKLINELDVKTVKHSSDRSKEVELMLRTLQHNGNIQLLEYRWVILPVETITILIVTDKNQKQFTYGE